MVGGEQEYPKIDFIFVGKIYNKKNPRNTWIKRYKQHSTNGTISAHGTHE